MPFMSSCWRTSREFTAFRNSPRSRSTIAGGVRAGA